MNLEVSQRALEVLDVFESFYDHIIWNVKGCKKSRAENFKKSLRVIKIEVLRPSKTFTTKGLFKDT